MVLSLMVVSVLLGLAYDRILFIFVIAKFTIWKSRNLQIFEGKYLSSAQIMSSIVKEIKLRVQLDRHRFLKSKFHDLWVKGNSFVRVSSNHLLFEL